MSFFFEVGTGGGGGGITLPIPAQQVSYDNTGTGLNSTTIQEVVTELKSKLDLAYDSNIYIVADKNELNRVLLNPPKTLRTGDIIYVLNSIGVVDYDGVDVDNGGKPVAMIYDDALTNNKLRLFSKVEVKINLDEYVSKNKDNIITGNNLITNGYVLGNVLNHLHNNIDRKYSATVYHTVGHRGKTIAVGEKLTHIAVEINENVPVGELITDIQVGIANKLNNPADEIINHMVVTDGVAYVQENTSSIIGGAKKVVVIQLDQPFVATDLCYVVMQCPKMAWGEKGSEAQGLICSEHSANPSYKPTLNKRLNPKQSGYIASYILYTSPISLNTVAESAISSVKTINGQSPTNGNIVVGGVLGNDNIRLTVNGSEYLSVEYMTAQQMMEIKNIFNN